MLALIAGQGALPVALCARLGTRPLIAALETAPPDLPVDLWFRLETLGSALDTLRARGVRRLCLAGAVRRPVLEPDRVDARTAPLLARLAGALGQGDDGTLRALMDLLDSEGFALVAAQDLAPDLLPPAGVPSRARPGPADLRDAARGAQIVAGLGALDLGQACVVAGGQALALEALPGTDRMLAGLSDRAGLPQGGILYKAPKPGQDRRADLPVIGPATIRAAAAVGLRGVVVAAGGVMVLDLAACCAVADAAGLFLWIREEEACASF